MIFSEALAKARQAELDARRALFRAIESYPLDCLCPHDRVVWYGTGECIRVQCLDCGRKEDLRVGSRVVAFISKAREATGEEQKELRRLDLELFNSRTGRETEE